jgi:hypothetical protein
MRAFLQPFHIAVFEAVFEAASTWGSLGDSGVLVDTVAHEVCKTIQQVHLTFWITFTCKLLFKCSEHPAGCAHR